MIISHRGNLSGPNINLENTIESLSVCIQNNINIELDIWFIDNKFYLGHDKPEFEFSPISFKYGIINIFFHCKNINAFYELRKHFAYSSQVDLFMHDKDDATLTKNGWVWTYPGKELFKDSIAVMPELVSEEYCDFVINLYKNKKIAGICTDRVLDVYYKIKEKSNE